MTRRGFTLIELLVVILILGAVSGLVYPRISRGFTNQAVRGARQAVTSLHAKARASAIQRGRPVALVRRGNMVLILSQHPVTMALDTVGAPINIPAQYGGVQMTWSRDSLVFDPRGIGLEATSTSIVMAKNNYADTILISPVGSVVR